MLTNPKKVFIGIILALVIGYGAYVYWDRFWVGDSSTLSDSMKSLFSQNNQADTEITSKDNSNQDNTVNDLEDDADTTPEEGILAERDEEFLADCANGCSSFSGSEKESCLEDCGLNDTSANPSDCSQKADADRDICYKEQAVSEKNDKLCNKIDDSSLKEFCVNAVAEEILSQN